MGEFLLQTSWCLPIYGLLGAVLTLPWSIGYIRRTGPRPAAYFNILMTLVAMVHGAIAFQTSLHFDPQPILLHWFHAADLDLTFAIDISSVSLGAAELITALSFLAQIFSLGYMEKDWAIARFFALMGFFEAAMTGVALSDSLFLTYALL